MSSEAELFIPLDYSPCNRLLYKILKEQSPVTSRTVSLFANYTSSKGFPSLQFPVIPMGRYVELIAWGRVTAYVHAHTQPNYNIFTLGSKNTSNRENIK